MSKTLIVCLFSLAFIAVGCWLVLTQSNESTSPPPVDLPPLNVKEKDVSEDIHTFCGACHAYPPPETFPKKHWRKEVEQGFTFFVDSDLKLTPPSTDDVVQYYLSRAPDKLTLPTLPKSKKSLPIRFEQLQHPGAKSEAQFLISNVQLVHLPKPNAPKKKRSAFDILACEMNTGEILLLRPYELDAQWQTLAKLKNPARTLVADLNQDGIKDILVADLGSLPPTDDLCGRVVWLRGDNEGRYTPIVLLDKVGRVSDVQVGDFRGTGQLDLIVGVFGWRKAGDVRLLENHTTDWDNPKFTSQVLDPRHGAIHTPVLDLNDDGRLDVVALLSQEHECIVAYLNKGNGQFESKTLYRASHPGYGSSGIQMVDFDHDSKVDILYTNGDVLDHPYFFKPYHKVQWLKNKGNLIFEYHELTPMPGAHSAFAADVTGNGLNDVLAVSYLPADKFQGRTEKNAESILLMEQTSPGKFERHVLGNVTCDHASCAVGDVTGNGKMDLVIGNFDSPIIKYPITIWKNLGR